MNIQRAGSLACLLCLFLCASLFVSCDNDDNQIMRTGDISALGFSVSSDGSASSDVATRGVTHVVDSIELEGNTFYLTCTVTDIDESAATRGTIIDTDNLSSVYGQFNVSAYENGNLNTPLTETDEGGNALTSPASYVDIPYVFDKTYTDGSATYQLWKTSSTGSFHWPVDQNVPLTFYAYAPTSDYTGTASWAGLTPSTDFKTGGVIQFDYTVPSNKTNSSSKRVDAEYQPDILVGSIPSIKRTDSDIINVGKNPDDFCIAPLTFYHALTAVDFKVGAALTRDVTINSLTLSGLKAEGKCTFTPPTTSGKHSADVIAWDFTGVTGNTGSYCQTYDQSVPTTAPATDPALGSDSQTFMLIPQTFGPSGNAPTAKVTITYNGDQTKTVALHATGSMAWLPGKKYTYTLTGDLNDLKLTGGLEPYMPDWF